MVKFKITELGIEKLCARCNKYYPEESYWPMDKEFFQLKGNQYDSWCRCCRREVQLLKAKKGPLPIYSTWERLLNLVPYTKSNYSYQRRG